MKVRAGFVSNSSSTSFLIIAREELEEEALLKLMGVAPDSVIADLFRELFTGVLESSRRVDLERVDTRVPPEAWFDNHRLSPAMIVRLKRAAGRRFKAYFGSLSSDNNPVQSFFCTDAFEVENEQIYFNYLECVW